MIERVLEGEWLVLGLRVVFVALLYLFLAQFLRHGVGQVAAVATRHQPAPTASAWLVVVDSGGGALRRGDRFRIEPGTTIGRGRGNTMRVDDAFLSNEHAVFGRGEGGWWIRDLGSTNGTAVNGKPVRATVTIRPGDVVQLGRIALRVDDSPREETPVAVR